MRATPSQPGSTERSPDREARVTKTVRGDASIDGVEAILASVGMTRSVSTPIVRWTVTAGKFGAGASETAAIGLAAAFGGGAASAPLIGAAIVARPRAPAMPTCGAESCEPLRCCAARRLRAAVRCAAEVR
jgi:hypothetical protein